MPRRAKEGSDSDLSKRQLDVEAKLLDEGRADIRAGRCVSGEGADEWLDGLDGDEPPAVV